MEIKCLHTGDLHLGMEFKNASFDIKHAQMRRIELWGTFNKIVDRAKDKKVHLLLIAGDLFEDDYCTIGDVKRIAGKLKEAVDTKVIIVSGNHDTLHEKSLYKLIKWPNNVYLFRKNQNEKIEFQDLNTIIWGLSWDKKEEKRRLLDHVKVDDPNKINILLVHGDILNKESEYLPIDKSQLIDSGFDYVALGHIHKPQFINERIGYCGSPEPLDFGETGSHGIIEGIVSKTRFNMNFVPFSKRRFIIKNIDISEEMNFNDVIERITQCDDADLRKVNLYRIYLKGIRDRDLKIDINEIKEMIRQDFYYIEMIDETRPDYDLEKIKRDNRDNIIGYFIEAMEDKGLDNEVVKDALYYGLEALLKEKVMK